MDDSVVVERPVVVTALEVVFWAEYQMLQERWRMGEKLTLARWGQEARPGAAQEMRQLRQELEALLVGFGV